MAVYQVLYWRNIPSQVRVYQEGKKPLSRVLPDGFQVEIDRVAMAEGLTGGDEYLEQWRWSAKQERDGSPADVLDAVLSELEREWGFPSGRDESP
jgi:hypothetical protein